MQFDQVKGSYDGYEYDMRDNRYKPIKNKKKVVFIFMVVIVVILSIFLVRRDPSVPEWFKPQLGTTYYHQETGDIDLNQNVDIYSVPLYSGDAIKKLQSKGKKVVCQYSVGLWKQGEPELDKKYLGNEIQPNAYAMDIRTQQVKEFVLSFIEHASGFGCDGFEPLDMNIYSRDNGLKIQMDDQLNYSKWIAQETHNRNMFTGIVDSVLQLTVIDSFDYVLSFNCFLLNNCDSYKDVLSNNKPVFDMETSMARDQFCDKTSSLKIKAFTKSSDFGPGAEYC
eukprot:NODE_458_length_8223_cov_0.302683.p3 type:complete len:280 gc:universal NODE_458_length_8223_cov_0.302683:6554-5715(-)